MKTRMVSLSVLVSLVHSLALQMSSAIPRPPVWPPLPEMVRVTHQERFDEVYHAGMSNEVVTIPRYGTLRASWSGYSLERMGTVTPLVIPGLAASGQLQVVTDQGAVRFWFSPYWSSASVAKNQAPGIAVPLLELAAVEGSQSAVVWSLQVSTDGSELKLLGPDKSEVLLVADIAWAAGSWHQIVLNYGTNGTELVLDGQKAAEGAATLAVPSSVTRLVVGSSLSGEVSAGGELEEVYCFGRPLRLAFHYLAFAGIAALGPMSEAELAYREELKSKWAALAAQKSQEFGEVGGGGVQMRLSGPATDCATNSPLYITNVLAVFVTNQNWTVTFEIQGTNGPADIFATTNLLAPLTNSVWVWLERGPTCSIYEYTNQATSRTFYILGTTNDTDMDVLTDAYELLVSKTLLNDTDTDNDGMPDGWEAQNGLNPLAGDASDDPDGDWLTNLQEYNGGTNSTNPHDLMVVAWGNNTDGQCNVPLNLRDVKAIAAGNNFSLALLNDGTVRAWGDNTYGQTNVPLTLTNAAALAAGAYHGLTLRTDGSASVWGDWWTQFGYSAANFPSSWSNLVSVAAGADHDLALLANGAIYTWSYYISNSAPYTQVPPGMPAAKGIAAGWDHSVALLTSGTVAAWGLNYSSFGWNVTNVPDGLSNVTAVAAGAWHTLALRGNGTVAAWGAGNVGNSTNNYLGAEWGQSVVPAGLSNVTAIAAKGYHSLALRADGSVVGWGDMASPSFLQSNVVAIAAGANHNLAIRSGRQLPLILQSPFGRPELPGSSVTYTALGLGLAGVHYQWQFNGVNLTGQTNATLTLTNISTTEVGGYTVVISSGAGAITSSVATLTLIGPPVITNTIPAAPSTNWVTNAASAFLPLVVQATALETQRYPLHYQWYTNGVAIPDATNQNLNLFPPWVPLWQVNPADADYTVKVWNPVGTNEAGPWTVRVISLPKPGSTVAWGNNSDEQIEYPINLTNSLAISAGKYHSVAVREDGGLEYWGYTWATLPNDLTNLVSVSAGYAHTLVLRNDGTVSTWGQTSAHANTVPTNNYGIKNLSAGTYHNLAVLTNGNILAWGLNLPGIWNLTDVPANVTNVTAVAAGSYHSLALKADGTVVSWGYNDSGQTNVPSGLSNIVAVAAGERFSLALKQNGTISAWGDNTENQCNVPAGLSNVMAIAAGRAHGVALKNDGTVVCWGDNGEGQTNVPSLLTDVKLIAAGGDHTLAAVYSPLVQYPVDVTKDVLLIYNTNSLNSVIVKDYYVAHRPMVGGANVLGVGGTANEITSTADFTNYILAPYLNWLNQNPTKHPQYLILFPDLPTRIWGNVTNAVTASNSVAFDLHSSTPGFQPFVTSINMGLDVYLGPSTLTNDCIAYINKLAAFGSNYSPSQLFISASQGGYGNTNYLIDNIRHGTGYSIPGYDLDYSLYLAVSAAATNGLIAAGVPSSAIQFFDGLETLSTNGIPSNLPHPTGQTNLAGYICWGSHSSLGNEYPINGVVEWSGSSGWWIIETIESFNGWRHPGQGNFTQWFSTYAFGGTNYSNTPVAAVTHTDEPGLFGVNNSAVYFRLWASGYSFASCAWNSRVTPKFQAVGDPFVRR